MTAVCNLNGTILPEAEASVSVLDRGFLFGDSVYEVMRTEGSIPFAWPEHLVRLRRSAEGIGLEIDLDDRGIMRRVKETLAAAEVDEAYIRIIVTRGTGLAPNIDLDFAPGPATYVVMVRELPSVASIVRLAVIPRLRTDRRSLDPGIKSGNYLNNLLGLAEARAKGATDCLFLNQLGHLTEASTANFYLVIDGTIYTPPLSAGLLSGITRGLLLDVCAECELPLVERDLTPADLEAADEAFLSSTMRHVAAVTEIDGRSLGTEPGAVTAKLAAAFEEFRERRMRERYAPAFAEV